MMDVVSENSENSDLGESLSDLVAHVVEEIVDHHGDVRVSVTGDKFHMLVSLKTNGSDVGQVVGRGGMVISALRSIISAFAGKNRMQATLVYTTERERPKPQQ